MGPHKLVEVLPLPRVSCTLGNGLPDWCPESYSCVGSNLRLPWPGSTLLPELPCSHSLQKRVGLGTPFVLFGLISDLGTPPSLRPSFGLLLCGFGDLPCPEGLFGTVVGFDAVPQEETRLLLFLVMVSWILMALLWDNLRLCCASFAIGKLCCPCCHRSSASPYFLGGV